MKITSTLFACILLAAPSLGRAEGFDGNMLLRLCKEAVQSIEQPPTTVGSLTCASYVRGLDDGMQIVAVNNSAKKHGTKATIADHQHVRNEMLYCVPNGVTLEQKVRVVTTFLEKNPQMLHQEPAVLTVLALKQAFPCK
ncbi:MAG: Rap1a/Tai family immunity protein [Sulfuricaulis sp.]